MCEGTGCVQFTEEPKKKNGFSLSLQLKCTSCYSVFSDNFTSPRAGAEHVHHPLEVNDRFVLFFERSWFGSCGPNKFCAVFGIKPMNKAVYQKKQNRIIDVMVDSADTILCETVARVVEAYTETDADFNGNITVSFDGSWHKRGHTSNYGFGAVIDVLTGLVVDYEVLSKYYGACTWNGTVLGKESAAFLESKENHTDCCVNYTGSSNAMEVEMAKRLWSRSEQKGLHYTGFLTDGDSKAYNSVVEMRPYGDTPTEKEECINHAQKRMGTALIEKSQEKGLGGKGRGKLTPKIAKYLQYKYRLAILSNIPDLEAMRKAVFATLFHLMSTDKSPHHNRCPTGQDSWCFFNKAIARNEKPAPPRPRNPATTEARGCRTACACVPEDG